MPDDPNQAAPPRANPILLGQDAAEHALRSAQSGGRLPHAWLISGPAGIGKATLAFRFARFLLAGAPAGSQGLAIAEEHPVFRRVASGGHADLLTVERQFDDEKGKQRKDIAVDDVRRIAPFLHLTAAEGGWRTVIVDGADCMNRSGQNAVLKILEEPPQRALLLLVTDRPASMLPTIRSRCRHLALPPLADATVDALLNRYRPDLATDDRAGLVLAASGSIGRALEIAQHGGLGLLREFLAIAGADRVDWPAAHGLGDRLAPAAADEAYRSFASLLVEWLGRTARELGRGSGGNLSGRTELVSGERALVARLAQPGRLERLLEVWEKVSLLFSRSDSANLDRRLTVISALDAVNAALR
jgi:DNA polymerase-3 subunit delta'